MFCLVTIDFAADTVRFDRLCLINDLLLPFHSTIFFEPGNVCAIKALVLTDAD